MIRQSVIFDVGRVLFDWDLRYLFAKLIADRDELEWFVTNVVTPGGLHGALVIRHAPFDEQAPHIVTLRATAALDVGEGFAVLGTATTDLAGFEAFRPYFLELIDSVVVAS